MGRRRTLGIQAGVVLAVAALWEAAPRAGLVDPNLLPPFSEVCGQVVTLFTEEGLSRDLAVTAGELIAAFAIVAPIGVGIGLLLAENEYLGRVFRPFFYFLASVPKSVFLPTFILLFGIGFGQKVAFGVFQAVFVLVISTVAAVRGVEPELVKLARSYGASRMTIYREIYWPSMLPLVIEGARLGVVFSITGVVFAEMAVARAGLGARIASFGQTFQMPSLYAGVLVVSLFSIAINELLRSYERRIGRWRV
jgi:ABC-type nitrate/sulfonate/bicarbonate transport system permease component